MDWSPLRYYKPASRPFLSPFISAWTPLHSPRLDPKFNSKRAYVNQHLSRYGFYNIIGKVLSLCLCCDDDDDELGPLKPPANEARWRRDDAMNMMSTNERDASSQARLTTTMSAYIYILSDKYRARRCSPMPPFPIYRAEERDDDEDGKGATKTTRLFAQFIIDPTHTTKALRRGRQPATDNMYYYSNPS